jgi:hypothetical protein
METVGDAFPKEQARVRKLLQQYIALGDVGKFGALMLNLALERADKAAISGDIVEILRSYQELKDCQ